MTIRCIDIETTGIDPENDAVVEIASVDILREGGITNRQEILGKYLGESTWICTYKCAQPVAALPPRPDQFARHRLQKFEPAPLPFKGGR